MPNDGVQNEKSDNGLDTTNLDKTAGKDIIDITTLITESEAEEHANRIRAYKADTGIIEVAAQYYDEEDSDPEWEEHQEDDTVDEEEDDQSDEETETDQVESQTQQISQKN